MADRQPPDRDLHLAMSQVALANTPGIQKARTAGERLLAKGANPNSIIGGLTPLSRLLQKQTEDHEKRLRAGMSIAASHGVVSARHNARHTLVEGD